MRVERVDAIAFGALRDASLVLAPGMTVVSGPNESAKSTWHAATYAALCGRRRGAGKRTEAEQRFAARHAPWGGGPWRVRAVLALDGGRRVEISHELRDRVDCRAVDLDTGADVSAEIVYEGAPDATRWLGLNRRSFAATACVTQADVLGVLEGRQALTEDLQRAAASAGRADVTAAEALVLIEDFRRERVGVDRVNAVKPLRRATVAVQEARDRRAAAAQAHAEYLGQVVARDGLRGEAARAQEALDDAEGARAALAELHGAARRAAQAAADARLAGERADGLEGAAAGVHRDLGGARGLHGRLGGKEPRGLPGRDDDVRDVAAALAAWAAAPGPAPLEGPPADRLADALAELPAAPDGDTAVHASVAHAHEALRTAAALLARHGDGAPPSPPGPDPLVRAAAAAGPAAVRQTAAALRAAPDPGPLAEAARGADAALAEASGEVQALYDALPDALERDRRARAEAREAEGAAARAGAEAAYVRRVAASAAADAGAARRAAQQQAAAERARSESLRAERGRRRALLLAAAAVLAVAGVAALVAQPVAGAVVLVVAAAAAVAAATTRVPPAGSETGPAGATGPAGGGSAGGGSAPGVAAAGQADPAAVAPTGTGATTAADAGPDGDARAVEEVADDRAAAARAATGEAERAEEALRALRDRVAEKEKVQSRLEGQAAAAAREAGAAAETVARLTARCDAAGLPADADALVELADRVGAETAAREAAEAWRAGRLELAEAVAAAAGDLRAALAARGAAPAPGDGPLRTSPARAEGTAAGAGAADGTPAGEAAAEDDAAAMDGTAAVDGTTQADDAAQADDDAAAEHLAARYGRDCAARADTARRAASRPGLEAQLGARRAQESAHAAALGASAAAAAALADLAARLGVVPGPTAVAGGAVGTGAVGTGAVGTGAVADGAPTAAAPGDDDGAAPDAEALAAALARWQEDHRAAAEAAQQDVADWATLQNLLAGRTLDGLAADAEEALGRAEAARADADASGRAAADARGALLSAAEAAGVEPPGGPDDAAALVADAEDRVARERGAVDGVNKRLHTLQGQLDAAARSLVTVAEAEEAAATAEEELERVRELQRILQLTRDFLEDAQERAHRSIAPVLVGTLTQWLPVVTGGRYTEAVVGDDLRVQVRGPAGALRDAELLSVGTAEQVYLLLRVALAQHLVAPAGGAAAPGGATPRAGATAPAAPAAATRAAATGYPAGSAAPGAAPEAAAGSAAQGAAAGATPGSLPGVAAATGYPAGSAAPGAAESCPLLLDDVTVQADEVRTLELLGLLHRLSADRQVVLFAQEPAVAGWARRTLTGPRDSFVELDVLPVT